jgi:hypothetical protein
MRTLVAVMCVVGLASGPGIVSHVPSDYQGKPYEDSIDETPAAVCKLPLATGSMHKWNKAEIGTITFAEPGLHLVTFHYNQGNNFAYFEFEHSQRE